MDAFSHGCNAMDNAIPLKPQVVEILGNRWQVTPRRIQQVSKMGAAAEPDGPRRAGLLSNVTMIDWILG